MGLDGLDFLKHDHAGKLLETCRYVKTFLERITPAEEKDQIFLREVALPYLNRQIAVAETKR